MQAEFENCVVQIDVFDANTVARNVLIGGGSVDMPRIYQAPGRELYKQWIALTDTTPGSENDGVQGELLCFLVLPCGLASRRASHSPFVRDSVR